MRTLALIPSVIALWAAPVLAQEKDKLPAPPKPPKWLKKELGDKLPQPKPSAEEIQPGEVVPDEPRPPSRGARPVRIRINTRFFRLNLGINEGGPEEKAVEVDVNVHGKKGMPHPKPLGQRWRYRRHQGRWWYWMPSRRWAVWDDNRWIEVTQEMLKSGELRLGKPERGNVRVKVSPLPGLNIGF